MKHDSHELETEANLAEVRRISRLGIAVNFLLAGMKLAAGFFGHSSVLIADGVNSLSDMLTDVVVLFGSKFWGRPADEDHPYGHAKIETLITLFIGAIVFLVGLGLLYGAVEAIFGIVQGREIISPSLLPFVVGLLAIGIKYALYRQILSVGMRIKSSAVIANAKNHQSDIWASIPAVTAIGMCLLLGDKYAFLDPLGAVLISVMIMYTSWEIVRPTFAVLLDGGTSQEQFEKISATIISFPAVRNFEKLRTRHLGPSGISVDVHIRVDGDSMVRDSHELTREIKKKLQELIPEILEVNIHIEPA